MSAEQPGAFSFKCPLDRAEIRRRLQELGSFEWNGGDSETYGLYLRGHPTASDWPVWLRVYGEEPPDYLLEFDYDYSEIYAGQSADPVIAFVKEKLLPAIGATDVKLTSGIR